MLAAANANLVRESDIPYSPFPVQQSMPTKYGTSVSSISGSTISVAEVILLAIACCNYIKGVFYEKVGI